MRVATPPGLHNRFINITVTFPIVRTSLLSSFAERCSQYFVHTGIYYIIAQQYLCYFRVYHASGEITVFFFKEQAALLFYYSMIFVLFSPFSLVFLWFSSRQPRWYRTILCKQNHFVCVLFSFFQTVPSHFPLVLENGCLWYFRVFLTSMTASLFCVSLTLNRVLLSACRMYK